MLFVLGLLAMCGCIVGKFSAMPVIVQQIPVHFAGGHQLAPGVMPYNVVLPNIAPSMQPLTRQTGKHPRIFYNALGAWIEQVDWLPIEINVPELIGVAGNQITSVVNSITGGVNSITGNILDRISSLNNNRPGNTGGWHRPGGGWGYPHHHWLLLKPWYHHPFLFRQMPPSGDDINALLQQHATAMMHDNNAKGQQDVDDDVEVIDAADVNGIGAGDDGGGAQHTDMSLNIIDEQQQQQQDVDGDDDDDDEDGIGGVFAHADVESDLPFYP